MQEKGMSEAERIRLERLASYNILDSAPEHEYDNIVQRAAELCDCPISTVTLLDRHRQWFKASVGVDIQETGRDIALCDHTIRGAGPLIIPDTRLDGRFTDNPAVTDRDGIRFYAGTPLLSSDNQALGTLCVMDYHPRNLSDAQTHYLSLLADQVMMHLELRRQNLRLQETVDEQAQTQRLTGIAGRLARVGAWSVDVASGRVTMSPEILALHGLGSTTRLTLDECLNFYSREDNPKIRTLFAACVNDGTPYDDELQVLDAAGQAFWVRALGEPVFNDAGEVIRVDGAFQDISDQRRTAHALREEKVRFEAAARATADAIWDWNTHTDRLWWSEGMQTLFGYSADDLEQDSRSWTTRIHPDDKRRVLTDIQRVIQSQQQKWEAEYRFMRKDGGVAYVSDRGYVIRDENGDALRMVGGMSDVTERRRFLANLARQAALLDQSSDAIMVLDLERRITYWNQAAETIYGWRQDQVLGRRIDDVLGEDTALLAAAARTLLDKGQWAGYLNGRNADGETVISEARWSLVGDDHGEPEAVLAINTDITERLALEEQLQQSQRLEAVGQLTGGVAHDFNNLLTVILGNSELLEEQLQDTPLLHDSARLIRGAAERAAELTRRLLAFARRQPLAPEIVDVNELINGLTPLLRPTLHEHVSFSIEPCPSPWPAFIDPGQLESAILNLCINARDAMPGDGRIVLETANVTLDRHYAKRHSEVVAGDYIQVVVSDTGKGIPAAALKRVFEPFFTTKPKGKGTGLGLSMVYGFVKQSRGHIKIDSEPGKGTTVKLYLPKAERDDRQPVDLLVTDVIMPGDPDGPELARKVRDALDEVPE